MDTVVLSLCYRCVIVVLLSCYRCVVVALTALPMKDVLSSKERSLNSIPFLGEMSYNI